MSSYRPANMVPSIHITVSTDDLVVFTTVLPPPDHARIVPSLDPE